MNENITAQVHPPVNTDNPNIIVIEGKSYITIREAVRRNYGCERSLRKKIKTGEIHAEKFSNGRILIAEAEFAKYLKRRPLGHKHSAA